ncbi:MAG: FAD-binding oxidoreductase [Pseudomonadota bacterium]
MNRIVVVGRGLIGSAAARHLAECTDGVVCIGPDEPQNRVSHDGVFASHYDEGRMTRHVDPMQEWAITAGQSIKRYRDIEERSGIAFYSPSGYLGLGFPGDTYNARCAETGESIGASLDRLDAETVRTRYPYLCVPDTIDGLVETGGAGHISPRRMVEAQTTLAAQAGATIVRQAARSIRAAPSGVEVELWDGSIVSAAKALIATGVFTSPLKLSPVDLGLTVYGRTTVLVRVEGEAVNMLRDMPTMIDTSVGAYILPPIQYPDGRSYLKMGIGTEDDPKFTSMSELQNWFKSKGSEADRIHFTQHLKTLIPVLETCSFWRTDSCAVTFTKSRLPIIDSVLDDRIFVAVGGCGKGAKGADEWGRIAAGMVRQLPWSFDVKGEKLALPN